MTDDRDSWLDGVRALPAAWKALVAIGTVLVVVAVGSAGWSVRAAAEVASYAKKSDVDAKIAAATVQAIERESAIARQAQEATAQLRMSAEHLERSRRVIELALMRRLVSMEAADREDRRVLRAEAARVARKALADLCGDYKQTGECSGESLEKASDLALDAK